MKKLNETEGVKMEKALAEKTGGYLIGDVAQMVGLSRDALRFYEKKGIIRADKKENGYRYYSEDDIYRLMYILYHRKMNTSLEEIGGLMSGQNSTTAMRQHVRQRMAEEEEALRRHSQAIMRLKLVEKDISRIEECMGRYSIRKFPKAYVMATCSDLQEGLRTWFKLSSTIPGLDMSYFYNMLTYTGEDLEEKGTLLLFYEELEKGLGREFNRSRYYMTEEPECIYTIMESENTLPDFDMIHKMVQWAHKHGLEPTERVYANDMTSFFAKDRTTYCLEIYMPFKSIASPV